MLTIHRSEWKSFRKALCRFRLRLFSFVLVMAIYVDSVASSQASSPVPSKNPRTNRSKEASQGISVVLTTSTEKRNPESAFSCVGRIYAYVRLSQSLSGSHVLNGKWIRPDGEVQESTDVQLDLKPNAGRMAYFWLQFDEESVLDNLRFGGGKDEVVALDGIWNLSLQLDDVTVHRSSFSVTCGKR